MVCVILPLLIRKATIFLTLSYDIRRKWKGLSPFGKKLVTEMNNIGMLIDVSHISDDAFYQVIELSKTPVIASHSSLRKYTPGFERNMNDDMLLALKKNGGVIQINFGSSFVTAKAGSWGKQLKSTKESCKNEGTKLSNDLILKHIALKTPTHLPASSRCLIILIT